MASFGVLKNPTAQQLSVRVSASGSSGKPCRSPPFLSPRCHTSAPHTSAPGPAGLAAAYRASTAEVAAISTSSKQPAPGGHPNRVPLPGNSTQQRRSSGFDDSYDSAVPMSGFPGWERVEEDLGLDDEPNHDPQEWEEMVSLLSFDGEEHKRVMRQMHGANARVEDMFASFDGDDFEAVMRAARGELPSEPGQPTDSPPLSAQPTAPGSDPSLYQSVCALRAAAMAAEVAKKQCQPVKKRRTPLGDSSSADAWMLQVPYAVSGQQQQHQGEDGDGEKSPYAVSAAGSPHTANSSQLHDAATDPMGGVSVAQGSKPAVPSSGPPSKAGLALQQMSYYLGISSCDSSSDGSCHASQDEQQLQVVPAEQYLGVVTAAAAGSNNIVSSRALASRLAPAAAARGDATAANASMVSRGAAGAAVLEMVAVAVAVAAEAPTAAAPAMAASQLAAMPVAWQGASQHNMEEGMGQQGAPGAAGRWGSRSTKSLRRALARLHHTSPPQ